MRREENRWLTAPFPLNSHHIWPGWPVTLQTALMLRSVRGFDSRCLMRWPMMGASSYFLLAGQRILARSLKGEKYHFSGRRSPDKRFGQKSLIIWDPENSLSSKNSVTRFLGPI